MDKQAILPDVGPAIRDGAAKVAKGIENGLTRGFSKVADKIEFARDLNAALTGGLIVAVLLIVVFLFWSRKK